MEIQITSVTMRYIENKLEGAEVHFNSRDTNDFTLSLNGFAPLTIEEYQGNESLDKLKPIIRQFIVDKIMGVNLPEEAPTE